MSTGNEPHRFTLFATAIGRCALVWNAHGIAAVRLPEQTEGRMLSRLHGRFPLLEAAVPPPAEQQAIDGMVALLEGQARDLRFCALDLRRTPPFQRRVYAAAQDIPPGKTKTYGEIATLLGSPARRAPSARRWATTPFPSSCPATASWPQARARAASRRPAASRPSCACC